MSFAATALFRRRCTSRSRTSPLLSTARQSQDCLPPITTAISSRCHCEVARWRLRRILGRTRSELQNPAPHGLVGDIQPALGEQILYVAIAQGEAKVEPHRMLDYNRRKAVASIRDCCHSTILRPGPTRSQRYRDIALRSPPDLGSASHPHTRTRSAFGFELAARNQARRLPHHLCDRSRHSQHLYPARPQLGESHARASPERSQD